MSITTGEWLYGVRSDGSIWLSLGDPVTGPHFQGDLAASEDDARLLTAAPKLLTALKLVWSMLDDGRIVRNTANDVEPDWALKMLTFTRELGSIYDAITKAEGAANPEPRETEKAGSDAEETR